MTNTNNLIKNISFYNTIIFLIITLFSSFKCYSTNNNAISLYSETTRNTTPVPNKPPPSYKYAMSERSSNILPTDQQALIIVDELSRAQEDTNSIETTTINIPIEDCDNRTRDNNCFYSFLKKYKAKILIEALPYATVIIIIIIIGILHKKDIITLDVFLYIDIPLITALVIYILCFLPDLQKKFITDQR